VVTCKQFIGALIREVVPYQSLHSIPKRQPEKQAATTQQHGKDEVTDAAGGVVRPFLRTIPRLRLFPMNISGTAIQLPVPKLYQNVISWQAPLVAITFLTDNKFQKNGCPTHPFDVAHDGRVMEVGHGP
jgi:hypothetical protein